MVVKKEKVQLEGHKLMYHVDEVSKWLKGKVVAPIYVEIGPTNRCNHRCVFCALDFLTKENKVDINSKVMISGLENMAKHGVKSVMFAGEGEPLLHKDINIFTQKAKEYGMDVSMTCNGVKFTQDKIEQCLPNLSWIRFSVDSGSSENYSQIHGTKLGDFDKIIKNIEGSVKFKDQNRLDTTIGVQFLMIPQNMGEEIKLAKILEEIGADNLQVKPYSHHPNSLNNFTDRKSTRLNSSHIPLSRMPSSA